MKKHKGLFEIVFVGLFVAIVVIALSCGSSSTSSNTNTNASASVSTENVSLADVEPQVVGICKTLADKIALFCKDDRDSLSEWQLKAIDDPDQFILECVVDERFENPAEGDLDKIESGVNDAADCEGILAAF